MTDDKEVAVTVTPEDMEFRALARAAGLPDIVISMYGNSLRRLVAAEREACANVCEEHWHIDGEHAAYEFARIIRARGEK